MKEKDPANHQTAVDDFRSGIGVNGLKNGAAYSSWLKAVLPRIVNFKDIRTHIMKSGTPATLLSLADPSSEDAQFSADRLDNLVQDCDFYKTQIDTLKGVNSSLEELFSATYNNYITASTGTKKA